MITTFTGEIKQDTIYQERYTVLKGVDFLDNIHEDIHVFLEAFVGRKIKITVETLDEDPVNEDLVTVTYKELYKRASSHLGLILTKGERDFMHDWDIKDISKSHALLFMSEEEFNGRCHSEVGA